MKPRNNPKRPWRKELLMIEAMAYPKGTLTGDLGANIDVGT